MDKIWGFILKAGEGITKGFDFIINIPKKISEGIENFVKKYNVILVEKGVPTKVHDAEKVYVNTTGNFGLATAGSGDVLTGLIAGLMAQKYEPVQAAVLGVYLHGLTADIAVPEISHQAFIASDIINYLGKAYMSLKK